MSVLHVPIDPVSTGCCHWIWWLPNIIPKVFSCLLINSVICTRWLKQYLPMPHLGGQTWLQAVRNLRIKDLVLIKDKTERGGMWPLALAADAFPDEDCIVWRVLLVTATSSYLQDVWRLWLLESCVSWNVCDTPSTIEFLRTLRFIHSTLVVSCVHYLQCACCVVFIVSCICHYSYVCSRWVKSQNAESSMQS